MEWCENRLSTIGFNPRKPPLLLSDYERKNPYRNAYLYLREQIIVHLLRQGPDRFPELGLLQKPLGSMNWSPLFESTGIRNEEDLRQGQEMETEENNHDPDQEA